MKNETVTDMENYVMGELRYVDALIDAEEKFLDARKDFTQNIEKLVKLDLIKYHERRMILCQMANVLGKPQVEREKKYIL